MPTLPQASITVSASRGNFYFPPFAVVHEDNLAPGKTGVAPRDSDPPTFLTPFDNATGLTEATEFSWNSGGEGSGRRLPLRRSAVLRGDDGEQSQDPKFAIAGLELPAKSNATWSVEVHGLRTTVDDATGPSGGLNPFAAQGTFWGPPGDWDRTCGRRNGTSRRRRRTVARRRPQRGQPPHASLWYVNPHAHGPLLLQQLRRHGPRQLRQGPRRLDGSARRLERQHQRAVSDTQLQ